MGKLKLLIIPIFVSLLLIPFSISFAQGEEVVTFESPEEESTTYEVTTEEETPAMDPSIYETEPVDDAVLYDVEYDISDLSETTELSEGATAALASMSIGIILFSGLIGLAGYVFFAVALAKIGKEMNYENSWFAWVPILQTVMMLKLGDQNPLLALLLLVPGIGALVVSILSLIALMKVTEKRGYDKALALIVLTGIGAYILLYLLAWKPKSVEAQPLPQAPVMATETPAVTPTESTPTTPVA